MNRLDRKEPKLRARVERIVGPLSEWHVNEDSFEFRARRPVTIQDITALSEEFGTEAINFNFGSSGEPGYSELTPGIPGEPGFVKVFLPVRTESETEPPATMSVAERSILLYLLDALRASTADWKQLMRLVSESGSSVEFRGYIAQLRTADSMEIATVLADQLRAQIVR